MEFIKKISSIKIISAEGNFMIEAIRMLEEEEDKVYLNCVEEIPFFKRGFVCDMEYSFDIWDTDKRKQIRTKKDYIKELVLVYIKKKVVIPEPPVFEYVFFK